MGLVIPTNQNERGVFAMCRVEVTSEVLATCLKGLRGVPPAMAHWARNVT